MWQRNPTLLEALHVAAGKLARRGSQLDRRMARAAFTQGNAYMRLRDGLGPVFIDAQFTALFSSRGRPAEAPWRLALVTLLQFAEIVSDRRAAECGSWPHRLEASLGLDLTDPGFGASVLSEFRSRFVAGHGAIG